MADVSVKMGVSGISQFKTGMNEAAASVKTLDAALKANEKQFARTGDAEAHLAAQTTLLNQKLLKQKEIADNAEKALKQMQANGVKETSTAYQNMQRKLIEATSAMMDTQDQLNNLGNQASGTAEKTDKLATSLGGLNRKVSLDQVISAIGSITSGLERAAGKAVDLGKKLWDTIMDSARRADDTATMAEMYGIDLDTFLRMQKLVAGGLDTSVEAILAAQDKLKKGVGKDSKEVLKYFSELGISMKKFQTVQGESGSALVTRDAVEVFWEAGKAIMAMGDAYDKEAAAQAIFGRSWKELVPLFDTYDSLEDYNAALAEQQVNSEETIRDLAALNDAVGALEANWSTLKNELIGSLAPALSGAADALSGLLTSITEYLKTDEGKKALEDMGKAVEGLFEDLGEIDPAKVTEGFAKVFGDIVSGMKWLADNWESVKIGIEGIGGAFLVMKGMGNVLNIIKMIDGLKGLGLFGGNGNGGSPTVTPAGENTAPRFSVPASVQQAALNAGAWANVTNMTNAGAVMDWFTHDTEAGRWFQNQISKLFGGTEQYATEGPLGDVTSWWESVKKNWEDLWTTGSDNTGESFLNSLWNSLFGDGYGGGSHGFGGDGVEIPVEPVAPEDAASAIAGQVGTVTVPVSLVWDRTIGGAGGGMDWNVRQTHANGLWSVPFDGYAAILHKGEQVVPAREVMNSRNYSSNLYVESMYMNNGQDAEGLAAAIAAANRRTMRGYGS